MKIFFAQTVLLAGRNALSEREDDDGAPTAVITVPTRKVVICSHMVKTLT